ncbi:R3H domain-containing protein 2-like, partial [Neltuma alba]|uniref:R3H domain-containing protein 2-like n=1 Tax=Neltuma alba TaxID=207710 RepID=UPI0010A40A47
VEELASLVKDNLPCKHLVLTMEEALINSLQDENTGSDRVLELEPMNSYSRLLLHRLAEIFGFAHESVGEGDDRHLVLVRCPETSIPPILVSDILWEYDEPQYLNSSHQILRRKETIPASQTTIPSIQQSLEKRKQAYLISRERIFSMNLDDVKGSGERKPRSVPVVARRMIAHALGQSIHSKNQNGLPTNNMKDRVCTDVSDDQDKNSQESNLVKGPEESIHPKRNSNSGIRNDSTSDSSSSNERNADKPQVSQHVKHGNRASKDYMKMEHLGAARRIFAHALGVHSGKDAASASSSGRELKKSYTE